MDVTVVGGGVIGLMSAHALAHRGHSVRVVARELGDETTSARAAASFKPSTIAHGGPYRALLVDARRELDRWTASGFAARIGISTVTHVEASDRPLEPRDYLDVMREVRVLVAHDGDHVPGGYAYGISYLTYFFDVPVTLPALSTHVTSDHGIEVGRTTVSRLADVASEAEVVVNAAGLGARHLAGDADVIPVRGQTVLVDRAATDVSYSLSADGYYLYPRADGIVLGGTADHGVEEDHDDPAAIERILATNARVLPEVRDATPLATGVGLRPFRRGGIRLEVDTDGPRPTVHAYGHGGSGWTLGPGTALWVAAAVDDLARRDPSDPRRRGRPDLA